MIADIRPGSPSSTPCYLLSIGSVLFFTANDGVNGNEMWKFDATTLSTSMVANIGPGSANGCQAASSTFPIISSSGADNTRLIFPANDGVNGEELWVTDGTATYLLADLKPGVGGSFPGFFTRVGSLVFFLADDGTHNTELWAVPLATFTGALSEPFGVGCPGTGGLVPKISNVGGPPVIGNGAFGVQVTNGLPLANASLFVSTVQTTLDLGGGCFVYLSLVPWPLQLDTATDVAGVATIYAGLPLDPGLLGFAAFAQWAVVDPAGYLGLVSLSDAMRIVIGGP